MTTPEKPRHSIACAGISTGISSGVVTGTPAETSPAATRPFTRSTDQSKAAKTSPLKLLCATRDAMNAGLAFTRNSFALIGLTVMFLGMALVAHPDLRQTGESQLMGWLQARQESAGAESGETESAEPDAVDRATATHPHSLPKQQAAVAYWLSKKYRVAPEPVSALVAEAYGLGARTKLDPHLILAVMAVESGFNPFAQSAVGAQGLMQVMTKVHSDKYEIFGGKLAAFDPLTNLRVGVKVLQECIARAGSMEAGLKFYVGAANIQDDGGYAAKVMAEHDRLKLVSAGRSVPLASPAPAAPAAPAKAATAPALPLFPSQTVPATLPTKAEATVDKPATLADS
jgi:Transglycosylase SLT domain